MPLPASHHNADVLLADGNQLVGFRLVKDENGNIQWAPGLAQKLAQQISTENLKYTRQPSEVDTAIVFENWEGGAGAVDAIPDELLPQAYSHSQGINMSYGTRGYLAFDWEEALDSLGAETGAPTFFLETSLGFFALVGTSIFQWDNSSLEWDEVDDASGDGVAYVSLAEMDGVVYALRGQSADYKYTVNGTVWTAFTDSDNNFDAMAVRGISSAQAILWGLKTDGTLKNTTDGRNSGVAWSAADQLAHTSDVFYHLIEANDDLYAFSKNGIIRFTGTSQESVWQGGKEMRAENNGEIAFLWEDGKIYATYGGRLLQYQPRGDNLSGPSLQFVYPTELQRGNPELNGTITAVSGDASWLYIALKNTAGNTYILQGKPDGNVWFEAAYLGANDCNAIRAVGMGVVNATNFGLFFGYGATTRYMILPQPGARPEDDLNIRYKKTGTLYGPWVSPGMRQFDSFLVGGRVIGENISAGMPITLAYELDALGSPTTLLTAEESGASSDYLATEVRFNRVRWVITMSTPSELQAPRFLGCLFHVVPIIPRKRMWRFVVEVAPGVTITGPEGMRWSRIEQESFLMTMGDKLITLHDGDNRTWLTQVQTCDVVATTSHAMGGYTEHYQVVLTEIVETTVAHDASLFTLDEDYLDGSKVMQ